MLPSVHPSTRDKNFSLSPRAVGSDFKRVFFLLSPHQQTEHFTLVGKEASSRQPYFHHFQFIILFSLGILVPLLYPLLFDISPHFFLVPVLDFFIIGVTSISEVRVLFLPLGIFCFKNIFTSLHFFLPSVLSYQSSHFHHLRFALCLTK